MRLLVCGDREWTDWAMIEHALRMLRPTLVIHGACRGADKLAGEAAKRLGIPVHPFPADWKKYRKAAGPIRNQQMLDEGKPDAVLAFHDNIGASKGTADMLAKANKAGIPMVRVMRHKEKIS